MAPDDPPEYNPEATWEQQPLGHLAAALAKVQAELPHVDKSKTAEIEGREGRRGYKYNYADLADVSEAILPVLGKHGLAFTAWPTQTPEGKFILAYTLMHQSGEHRDGIYPLPPVGNPQALGSAITYGRRYCLCAVTGVAADEDDDGAAASEAKPARQAKPQRATPRAEANGLAEDAPGSASKGQVTAVQMAYQKLGFERTEREQMLDASEQILRRKLTGPNAGRTHNNLSFVEARKLAETVSSFGERGDLLAALVEAATP